LFNKFVDQYWIIKSPARGYTKTM